MCIRDSTHTHTHTHTSRTHARTHARTHPSSWGTWNSFTLRTCWPPCWKGLLCLCLRVVLFGISVNVPKHRCLCGVITPRQEVGQGAWLYHWFIDGKRWRRLQRFGFDLLREAKSWGVCFNEDDWKRKRREIANEIFTDRRFQYSSFTVDRIRKLYFVSCIGLLKFWYPLHFFSPFFFHFFFFEGFPRA